MLVITNWLTLIDTGPEARWQRFIYSFITFREREACPWRSRSIGQLVTHQSHRHVTWKIGITS